MRLARVSLVLALLACTSEVTQGVPYDPPNELPIGEPTDRSDEPDGGRRPDAESGPG